MPRVLFVLVSFLATVLASAARAEDASIPVGEPVMERPTLRCLGAYWIIRGDDNRNASIAVEYRKGGQDQWRKAMPLFRVEKGAHVAEQYGSALRVPADGWLFAGSVVMLDPDPVYEMRLTLLDPDGGSIQKVLSARTRAEPAIAKEAPRFHVVPGSGGGTGTSADPFKGVAAAQAAAKPGDMFLLHKGVYEGEFTISKSGEPSKPIVWSGAGDGEAVIDAQGGAAQRPERGISASDVHDVWFERLSVRNANWAIVAHDSARIVVRRCHLYKTDYGFTATRDTRGDVVDYFISDNLMEGPCTWPRTKGIENPRGVQISGQGHVVCYNRVRGFADGIDTFPSPNCAAIDIHNNDISECTDDGAEMDYSQRNTRNFENRYTNVFQGISEQPIFGGPVYIFRNILYNVELEVFKMHNSPSGALIFHNTAVKSGPPLVLYAGGEKVRNSVYRNNLFIGTAGNYGYECRAPMVDCDFDYDGFGGSFPTFLYWNQVRYTTMDEARAKAPVYRHAVLVDLASAFASGARPPTDAKRQCQPVDMRLSSGSAAVNAGQVLPNFNDGFAGKGPDLGAVELGDALPHYGPRPE